MADPAELVFVPLGGLGEIGMNAALYGYGPPRRREWLLVDLGVAFAGEDMPGVDLIMPALGFIEQQKERLAGIVLTHAHEDHFGAVADLWPRLGVPLYATQFAADLLEARRLSEKGAPKVPIRRIGQATRFSVGPFDLETVPVAHSIPESCALILRTPAGTVVHTGDWKIDPTPVLGLPTDEARFRAIGDEGVLALVCDSTNILREGESASERQVADALKEIIAGSPGRVLVTTFASNVARIRAVAEAAAACGRQVIIAGRAMERVAEIAAELGMFSGLPPFRGPDAYQSLPRDKVVVLVTGSQGEPRAALARIAAGEYPDVRLASGDRVIFSSRAIPGNEKAINRIINALARQDIEIITDRHGLVHVSGHPRRDEVRRMYEWVRPKIAIPAHGEALHLTEHRAFARSMGVDHAIRAFNGDLVRLAPGDPVIVQEVPHGRLVKDGMLITEETGAVAERRKLAYVGIVTVAFAIDERGEFASDPEIETTGIPETTADGTVIAELALDAVEAAVRSLGKARRRDVSAVQEAVRRAVRSAIADVWDKKPVCQVFVLDV
ncbi:MAG TPA: ribonuclease J [Beijerinckiaceae bacterium]|nr:ribonuclease J [Beijerinckiaceae bacterium]